VTSTGELRVKLQPATTLCSWFVPDPIPEVKLSAAVSARVVAAQTVIKTATVRMGVRVNDEILVFIKE
jgi:hypothetical protein